MVWMVVVVVVVLSWLVLSFGSFSDVRLASVWDRLGVVGLSARTPQTKKKSPRPLSTPREKGTKNLSPQHKKKSLDSFFSLCSHCSVIESPIVVVVVLVVVSFRGK